MEQKRKLLYREGSSKKDFKDFPIDVQKDMGMALFIVQSGGMPDSSKPWKGLDSGVHELVEDHRGDTFRAVYTVKVGDAVQCAACVPEEIQVQHRHATAGCGVDRATAQNSACPLWGEREIDDDPC